MLKTHKKKENKFTGVANMKCAFVSMGVSRAITQISTSNLVFFMHIHEVQLRRYAIKIIISPALCEKKL
jgi:hypothetical protein